MTPRDPISRANRRRLGQQQARDRKLSQRKVRADMSEHEKTILGWDLAHKMKNWAVVFIGKRTNEDDDDEW